MRFEIVFRGRGWAGKHSRLSCKRTDDYLSKPALKENLELVLSRLAE
jgi:hypothetical protein